MSNKRITDLTELTTPTTDDVFPVVDIATNTTQKVQLANLPVQTAVTTALATKQDTLVSGTNIKTVNSTSLVGSGNVAVQPTLVSGTNIKTLNSVSLLGSGDIVLAATPSGVAGAIQFSNGSAFASDATNLFWDDTNNRLGVGTNAPSATAHFKGSGNTSGTKSLLIQNLAGTTALQIFDDLTINFTVKDSTLAPWTVGSTNGRFSISPYSASLGVLLQSTNLGGGAYQPITFWGSNFFMQTDGSLLIANNTGLGNSASAKIEIQSTTQGFLPPRMTTTQRNAIASPAAGLMIYNTTTAKLNVYTTAWEAITSL